MSENPFDLENLDIPEKNRANVARWLQQAAAADTVTAPTDRGAWRIIAQRVLTGEILSWEVPLSGATRTRELSGPGGISGRIEPELQHIIADDGRPLIEEWSTALYYEEGGQIRAGGIVQSVIADGAQLAVDAPGFSSYPNGVPITTDYIPDDFEDPAKVFANLWAHMQAFPDANLGINFSAGHLRTNMMPNPSIENHTVWWAPSSPDVEISRVTAPTPSPGGGTSCLQVVSGGSGMSVTSLLMPVVAGRSYAGSVYLMADTVARGAGLSIGWYNKNGTLFAGAGDLSVVATTVGSWTRYTAVGVAPPGTKNATLSVTWQGDSAGDAQYLDAAMLEEGTSVGTYFDGSTEDGEFIYEWLGEPHNSPSIERDSAHTYYVLSNGEGPYKVASWEYRDYGTEINNILQAASMDYTEQHAWSPDHQEITHTLKVGFPRLGRKRDDLRFAQGENIVSYSPVGADGALFSNEVHILGSGEGSTQIVSVNAVRDGRLRRPVVVSRKADTQSLADLYAAQERTRRELKVDITQVQVMDHPNAPIAAIEPGDDVLTIVDLPWFGELRMWLRVLSIEESVDNPGRVTLKTQRSDAFSYAASSNPNPDGTPTVLTV